MLSDTAIRKAQPGDSPYKMTDEKGLYLLVQPRGGKLWRYDYRFSGKRKTLSLGQYPDVSLADAREKHAQARSLLADSIDPSMDKQRTKSQKKDDAEQTFESVAQDWLTVKSKKDLAQATVEKISKSFKANVYGRIGKLPIKDIIYKDVRACLLVMQKRNSLEYMHKTRGWIKNVFDFAVNDGILDRSPITAKDARLDKHEGGSFPFLQSLEDAGKLLRNLTEYPGSIEVQICVQMMLHVAQRPSELRKAKWDEFDFKNALWTLPLDRSKTRKYMSKPHTIMLSKQVLSSLEKLKDFTGHQEYLFKSRRDDDPVSEATIRKAFRNTFTDYHIVPHGCRHFFSTTANESGLFRKEAINKMIQHKDKDVSEASNIYNQATYDAERKEIAQWWSDQLDRAAKHDANKTR